MRYSCWGRGDTDSNHILNFNIGTSYTQRVATLTEVSYNTRKFIKYGSICLVLLIVGRALLLAGIAYWEKMHPPPPPPPTVEFGKLKTIQFPEQEKENINYTLQLPTIDFPEFPDRAKVFVMPYKLPSFTIWDTAKAEAAGLGFKNAPEELTSNIYRWTKTTPVTATLKMNIVDGSFVYNYFWQEDPNIMGGRLPSEAEAAAQTLAFIGKAKKPGSDLTSADYKITYVKYTGNELIPTLSISEGDLVKANLFRANIEEMPVVTPIPSKGIVSALLSGYSSQPLLEMEYNYFPVDYSSFATYPIKTAGQAWEELKQGKGYISSSSSGKNKNVVVRRAYLGFYDSYEPQTYLQPIYIFSGDDDFLAYVPAIIEEWYQ